MRRILATVAETRPSNFGPNEINVLATVARLRPCNVVTTVGFSAPCGGIEQPLHRARPGYQFD
jgi:hypothetical protein